ncbi:MAG TPA: adenosylcobinamide-GDP ribazoletransferase [Chloroflexota bacterium]
MYGFLVALQFLTRLPSPIRRPISLDDLGRSVAWFPLVGATIGAIVVGLNVLFQLLLHPAVAAALTVASVVAISGALHLDGVIDTVDGLAAGGGPAGLATMRDPAASSSGAAAGLLVLFATYAALISIPAPQQSAALFVAVTGSRANILLSYHLYPYARPEAGFSSLLKREATRPRVLVGLFIAGLLAGGAAGFPGLILMAAAGGLALVIGFPIARRLGGLTGDVHGALCEVAQLTTLLAAPLVLTIGG